MGSLGVSLGGSPVEGVSRGPGVTREEKCVKTIVFFCIFLRDLLFRLENLRVTLTVCDK